jgi:hypothetical protein
VRCNHGPSDRDLTRTAVGVGSQLARHDEFIKARVAAMEHLPRASRAHNQPLVTDPGNHRDAPQVRLASEMTTRATELPDFPDFSPMRSSKSGAQSGSATPWSLPFQAGNSSASLELLIQPPLAQMRLLAHAQSGAGGGAALNSISLGASVCDSEGEVSGPRECDAPIFSFDVVIS